MAQAKTDWAQKLLIITVVRCEVVGARRGFTVPADVSLTYLLALGLSVEQEKQGVVFLKSRVPGRTFSGGRDFCVQNREKTELMRVPS